MGNMKSSAVLLVCALALLALAQQSLAIPDSDIYNFRSSMTASFYFDDYNPTNNGYSITRYAALHAFFNESQYYYVIIRASEADSPPYDDFYISFTCDNDPDVAFHTTDYTSWVESGQISFKRQFTFSEYMSYANATMLSMLSYCTITNANSLVPDGNSGYTTFRLDLVPSTASAVTTLEAYCDEASLHTAVDTELSTLASIVDVNIKFISTIFTVFQILAVIIVVLGIPIVVLLAIRFVIWKITGHRLFEREA